MSKLYIKRKLVHGVGVNDADYKVEHKHYGERAWSCHFYNTWSNMLCRSYNKKYIKMRENNKDVTVCESWHLFSNFRKWMKSKNYKNKYLDKDILIIGNKIYSPETCCFIPPKINALFNNNSKIRGSLPIGVGFDKSRNKFYSRCNDFYGGYKFLGYFDNKEDAFSEYCKFKSNLVTEIVKYYDNELEDEVIKSLLKISNLIKIGKFYKGEVEK